MRLSITDDGSGVRIELYNADAHFVSLYGSDLPVEVQEMVERIEFKPGQRYVHIGGGLAEELKKIALELVNGLETQF